MGVEISEREPKKTEEKSEKKSAPKKTRVQKLKVEAKIAESKGDEAKASSSLTRVITKGGKEIYLFDSPAKAGSVIEKNKKPEKIEEPEELKKPEELEKSKEPEESPEKEETETELKKEKRPERQGSAWQSLGGQEGQLAIDVYQTDTELVIQSTIAGVKPEDLDISIESDAVLIRGNREHLPETGGRNYFYQECFWGPFSRQIILPEETDSNRATAEMKEGVLTIRIPKIERKKKRKIAVKG